MARTATRRTPKTARARKPAGFERIRTAALKQAKVIARQGAAMGATLQTEGRKLATAKAREARAALAAGADRATEVVTRYEKVFQDRVCQAMSKLGVPTQRDVRTLTRQVAQLQQSVDKLRRSRARAH
jgi:poly(hydroxyalkanoate) granule-associated protein